MQALQRYQILDTPPDGAFDRVTALAAKLLKVPISIASLVDTDRIWFKSHHGLDVQQIDRVPGLCASAILNDVPYILNDAGLHPRSLANPLVAGEFGLRFYVGIPLTTHDHNLGVLSVIDFEPRTISEDELDTKNSAKLINLLGNAIKFTKRGTIQVFVNLISVEAEHVHISVTVRDSGIGIDNDKIDRLFQTFSQYMEAYPGNIIKERVWAFLSASNWWN
jgi:signal transduction protein with GAF and PtsI domain